MALRGAIQQSPPNASRPASDLLRGSVQTPTQTLAPPGFAGIAPAIPRVPKLGIKVEVKREPPTLRDPEDHRPWRRRVLDEMRNLVKIDTR